MLSGKYLKKPAESPYFNIIALKGGGKIDIATSWERWTLGVLSAIINP
jgi:hypothetical protein